MKKIEHIGIAVNNMEESCDLFEKLLGVPFYKQEMVSSEAVNTTFFLVGTQKIELLSSTSEDSSIAKFIKNKGEGIHHIAFHVDDILAEMNRLKEAGFVLINEVPRHGADDKLVCFVHPKTTSGVLIELCQNIMPL